jgi:hypothetical protein
MFEHILHDKGLTPQMIEACGYQNRTKLIIDKSTNMWYDVGVCINKSQLYQVYMTSPQAQSLSLCVMIVAYTDEYFTASGKFKRFLDIAKKLPMEVQFHLGGLYRSKLMSIDYDFIWQWLFTEADLGYYNFL